MPPEITVYAELPFSLTRPLDLTPQNWSWVHCLTFPINDLHNLNLSRKPYKWIRYAIGVVVGAQGDLFDVEGRSINYESDCFPAASIALRYHVSEAEKGKMFPADPHFACSTVSSSVTTARVHDFRRDVEIRDGVCPVTGDGPSACDAAHLVAHSKGDLYIQRYTQNRGRFKRDFVDSIDDTRNGIFLNAVLRKALGKQVAFLVTPNFALDTTDIDPDPDASRTESRCTAHILAVDQEYLIRHPRTPGPYGSTVHIATTPTYPPPVLFDAVYASAILTNFASPNVKQDLTDRWSDIIYPGPGGVRHPVPVSRSEVRNYNHRGADDYNHHGADVPTPDGMDMLSMFPYLGIPRDKLPVMLGEMDEMRRAEERGRVEDKVNGWRGGLCRVTIDNENCLDV